MGKASSPQIKHKIVIHDARQLEYPNSILMFGQMLSSSEKTDEKIFKFLLH